MKLRTEWKTEEVKKLSGEIDRQETNERLPPKGNLHPDAFRFPHSTLLLRHAAYALSLSLSSPRQLLLKSDQFPFGVLNIQD